jgi:uncharacterized protein YdaU (DUF1376 family)
MSTVPYMPLFVADYLGDTTHLSTEEHGAYMLLLMAMWQAGGELPADPERLARMARMSVKRWEKIAPVVLAYFTKSGDFLHQKRLTQERLKVGGKSAARRDAQKASVEARALKNNKTGFANAIAKDAVCELQNGLQNEDSAIACQESILNTQEDSTLQSDSETPRATGDQGEASSPLERVPPDKAPPDDWPPELFTDHRVAERISALVGSPLLDPAKHTGLHLSAGVITQWRAQGCSWALDVLPALTATVQRLAAKSRPDPIRSWLFFDGPVYGNRDRRLGSAAAHPTPVAAAPRNPQQARLAAIADAFRDWRGPGTPWPAPDRPAAADLDAALEAFGSRTDRVRLAGWRQARDLDSKPGDDPRLADSDAAMALASAVAP